MDRAISVFGRFVPTTVMRSFTMLHNAPTTAMTGCIAASRKAAESRLRAVLNAHPEPNRLDAALPPMTAKSPVCTLGFSRCARSQQQNRRDCILFGAAARRENQPFKRAAARSETRIYMSRDKPDIGILALANGASNRARSAPIVAIQRMSSKRSFAGVDLTRTETALSPQPSSTIQTPDNATLR